MLFDVLKTTTDNITGNPALLANDNTRQFMSDVFEEIFIRLKTIREESNVKLGLGEDDPLGKTFRNLSAQMSEFKNPISENTEHLLLLLLKKILQFLELIFKAMGYDLAKGKSDPMTEMSLLLNRISNYDNYNRFNPPNYNLSGDKGPRVLTASSSMQEHLNRDHLTEDENKNLDEAINAHIEAKIARKMAMEGNRPVAEWEVRGLKDYDPSQGRYGLARMEVNADRDYYVAEAEKAWLASNIGKKSLPGQAIAALAANEATPINRQELSDLERADLDFRTPSIVKGENSTEAIREYLGRQRWADDQFDDDRWSEAADNYSSLKDATKSVTENDINEFREATIREAEQSWLKTPVGQNSKPGQVAEKIQKEEKSHWVQPSTKNNPKILENIEESEISKNDPTLLDRQKLTSLERADLDFRTPSIVKGGTSSEAIRTHLGERRWAQDKHDNDDWGDYSSLQHAKSSITENEINEFRQRTLNQAEQDWLKTPIGQNSKLGQQIAREKVDNSSVTMSKPSGSTILENSINQVRAVSENINKTEMAINDSDPTQTEEQSNNLVIK